MHHRSRGAERLAIDSFRSIRVSRNSGSDLPSARSTPRYLNPPCVEPPHATDLGSPAPFAKIFPFRVYPNHFYIRRRLVPLEGRIAIVTDAGRDAVDAAALSEARNGRAGFTACERSPARGRTAHVRTAKSCGPDASTPASSLRRQCRPDRADKPVPLATVTNKPDHRGEHEVSR